MRRLIYEQPRNRKFEKLGKLIIDILDEFILPEKKWVCGFEVEPLSSSGSDSIMVIIKLRPNAYRYRVQSDRDNLVNEVWAIIYDTIGIATYVKFELDYSCEKYHLSESRKKGNNN